jgi:hypothetical protein
LTPAEPPDILAGVFWTRKRIAGLSMLVIATLTALLIPEIAIISSFIVPAVALAGILLLAFGK